jgi:hypothetical protein
VRKSASEIRPGDIIVFQGDGFLFEVLSRLLKLFERNYERWGWHTAFVFAQDSYGWIICEALVGGVTTNYLDTSRSFRVYRWFASPPWRLREFICQYIGCRYDILLYPWTAVQYLIRHYWNRPIPRLLDNKFTCWELVAEMCESMGKPIVSKYDCPIITDILKALEK